MKGGDCVRLISIRFAAALLAAWFASTPAMAALSANEAASLEAAARPGAPFAATHPGLKLAGDLGKRADMEGLQRLIALRYRTGILVFSRALAQPASAEFEAVLLQHWSDREVAAPLLYGMKGVRDPRLIDLMLADVRELAQWRAERRRNCRAVVSPKYEPGLEKLARYDNTFGRWWSYVCSDGRRDDPKTDLDSRLKRDEPDREASSVESIADAGRFAIVKDIAPLLRPLALLPPIDTASDPQKPPYMDFSPVTIHHSWVNLFSRRAYGPSKADVASLRDALPPPSARHVPQSYFPLQQMAQLLTFLERVAEQARTEPLVPKLSDALQKEPWVVPDMLRLADMQDEVRASLSWACIRPVPEDIFAMLLDRGADVNANNLGYRPASSCSRCPHCIRALAARGANFNIIDPVDRSPLELAIEYRDDAAVEMLLQVGADPNLENRHGDSPFSKEALGRNDPDMIALMARYGGRVSVAQRARDVARRLDPRSYQLPH